MAKRKLEVVITGDAKGATGAMDATERRGGKFADKMKSIAGKVSKLALAGGVAAGAALGAGVLDALDRSSLQSGFEASLGVSPEYAASLGKAAGDAYANGFGGSLDEVAGAVGAVQGSVGSFITEADLQPITEQALALSESFNVDLNEALGAAGSMLKNGLVADAQEGLDVLTKGLQGVPQAVREEILAATSEYGKHFDALGISGAEAIGMLRNADGVIGVDKIGDALKELTIRGTDMSTASVDAFSAMGLSAGDMSMKLIAGGDTARGALDEITTGLLGIKDPVAQSNAAIALFGTPLEDLGTDQIPAFLHGLSNMESGLGDTAGAAQAMADKVNSGPAKQLEKFKRRALGGLANFAAKHVIPQLTKFGDWFSTAWPKMVDAATPVVEGIVDKITPIFTGIADAVASVDWQGVLGTITDLMGKLADKGKAAFKVLEPGLSAIVDFVKANPRAVFAGLATVVVPLFVAWAAGAAAAAASTLLAMAPVLLLVAGLALLGGAVYLAYEKVGWFRDGVQAVASFLTDTLWPALQVGAGYIVDTVVPAVVDFAKKMGEHLQPILASVGEFLTTVVWPALQMVASFITDTVVPALASFATWINDNVVPALSSIASFITDTVVPAVADIVTGFVDVTTNVGASILQVIDWVSKLGGGIADVIGPVKDALIAPFKTAFKFIAEGWNATLGGFSVSIPDIPGLPGRGQSFTIPEIPVTALDSFHTGGIFRAPHGASEGLALLRDRERVLTPSQRADDHDPWPRGGDEYVTVEVSVAGSVVAERDLVEAIYTGLQRRRRITGAFP